MAKTSKIDLAVDEDVPFISSTISSPGPGRERRVRAVRIRDFRRPLEGKTVALLERRESTRFAQMLTEKGATVLHYPLVDISDSPDREPLRVWMGRLVASHIQELVLTTGEGLRRILSYAASVHLHGEVVGAIANLRTITRGPKPARALRDIGLLPAIPVEIPTTDGIIDVLRELRLEGRTVGVQLSAQAGNPRLLQFLSRTGAKVLPVSPYCHVPGCSTTQVVELIERLISGGIDAIAFTCSAQVRRLFQVADAQQSRAELKCALGKTKVAAIGPVSATALRAEAIRIEIVPAASFFLRSLVNEIVASLSGSSVAQRA